MPDVSPRAFDQIERPSTLASLATAAFAPRARDRNRHRLAWFIFAPVTTARAAQFAAFQECGYSDFFASASLGLLPCKARFKTLTACCRSSTKSQSSIGSDLDHPETQMPIASRIAARGLGFVPLRNPSINESTFSVWRNFS